MESDIAARKCDLHFSKHFSFFPFDPEDEGATKHSWYTQDGGSGPEIQPKMRELRDDLNRVKSKLNKLPLKSWHEHTASQNPAGNVFNAIKREAEPEILTQAWCKFTECLYRYDLVPCKESVHSVHLCEAPGAFVGSLHHYLGSTREERPRWTWQATTLNPFYEGNSSSFMINDDRLMLTTLDNWILGDRNTGNILEVSNRQSTVEKFMPADLVTADGSIDCQDDPANQEIIVGPIKWAEVAVALNVLQEGGNFVLKMFTLFEVKTSVLLYLLSSCFERVSVCKPVCSKEGNSEVYVICQKFRDNLSKKQKNLILQNCHSNQWVVDAKEVPEKFLDQVVTCAKFFKETQCDVIEKNLDTFNNPDLSKAWLHSLKKLVVERFMKECRITRIKERLVKSWARKLSAASLNMDKRKLYYSFEERTKGESNSLPSLMEKISNITVDWVKTFSDIWISSPKSSSDLKFTYGFPFESIRSSKFCPSSLISNYEACQSLVSDGNLPKRRKVSSSDINGNSMSFIKDVLETYPRFLDTSSIVQFSQPNLLKVNKSVLMADIRKVMDALENLEQNHQLILMDLICLTRIDCALVLLLSSAFADIGFCKPQGMKSAIIFSQFAQCQSPSVQAKLARICEALENETDTEHLLELTDVRNLVIQPFYSHVVAFNCLQMKEKALTMLRAL